MNFPLNQSIEKQEMKLENRWNLGKLPLGSRIQEVYGNMLGKLAMKNATFRICI